MKIGIVGAGHIGGTLARGFVKLGHAVEIANSRGPETLAGVAKETGATPVALEEAVRGKDVVVLTIPMKAVPDLPEGLFERVPAEVPVIDTCNYYPQQRDGRIDAIEKGMVESQWVSLQIGHSTVKVFNNIRYDTLGDAGRPRGTPGRIALPVAGDDAAAKAIVMALVDDLGFDPVDNGPLANSWRQQPGTPGYVNNSDRSGVIEQLEAASRTRLPAFSVAA